MSRIFLSHSTDDDAIARALQRVLGDHGLNVWIDSREMRGGDPLSPEIQHAIESADAFIVLVSPSGLRSNWVGRELKYALGVQKRHRAAATNGGAYPVVPLLLDDTELGMTEVIFGEPPRYIPVSSAAGGVEAALDPILVALGKRAPADVEPMPQPRAELLEELLLQLTDLQVEDVELEPRPAGEPPSGAPGTRTDDLRDVESPAANDPQPARVRRATARACLVYHPATPGQRPVVSKKIWRFVAPLGPIEADELRWYLEKYAIWPGRPFRDRAHNVEKNLAAWGARLHNAAMPAEPNDGVMRAWAKVDGHARRRFSIEVDARLDDGASEADVAAAREAATLLLSLPWELIHDGDSFLFQGARPTRVRRRLPNTRDLDVAVLATPIRILLISARPENAACPYIDHRISAEPLVDAMEQLPGLVDLHVLTPPTLPALRKELERARSAREPYHVVHFDGHGVYDRRIGLGSLCFEHPDDDAKLEGRRQETITTDQLGPLLKDHRIPLVFLEACQTAQAEQVSESVASELLQRGVASVVAMSHSVLVETARRFVTAFYAKLAAGGRVGDAMLEGQRSLKDDTRRGQIFGAGELRLEDWFVPVLFQEQDDPQLFRQTPAKQTRDDFQVALRKRLGNVPPEPPTTFIGRSRDLLALERLLGLERYAVLRGQGGEGKTALAAELARWMVRSQRFRRAAFVSVENHSTAHSVLDVLGRQLMPGAGYSVATYPNIEQAEQPVARALVEQPTLLVVDNLESVLQPPYLAASTPEAVAEDTRSELVAILALCERLHRHGETRLVFTSREALPAPFDGEANRRELHRLHRDDAVKLIERVVNECAATADVADAERAAIEDLVEAAHGHARTLALLAPSLRRMGVAATREALVELMVEMDRRFPGQREQSLFASVELSLRRLSPDSRQRAQVLSVFHGGASLDVLWHMMEWDEADVLSLGRELVDTGLATSNRYNHLSLDPALCPYLRNVVDETERVALTARWWETMRRYVGFLHERQSQNTEMAAVLARLELANLLVFLDEAARHASAEVTMDLISTVHTLLADLGLPRTLARVSEVREAAAAQLNATWSHAHFEAELCRIYEHLASDRPREALAGAAALLEQARAVGERAYQGADYDLAKACVLFGRALNSAGDAQRALQPIEEAQRRFEAVAKAQPGGDAARLASTCLTERGHSLLQLGRLDDAAATYEESIRQSERRGDERELAVVKCNLGSVHLKQHRYQDALEAYAQAREQFARLGDPGSVAVAWYQMGMVHQFAGQPEGAEDAYRQSLAISVQLGDHGRQAAILNSLGDLYSALGRLEEAAALFRAGADHCVTIGNVRLEGRCLTNLGNTLHKLGRPPEEARLAIRRAITCKEPFGHTAAPWLTWAILANIEAGAGHVDLAAQARAQARACYLAYRRAGGENHDLDGRVALAVTAKLLAGDAAGAIADLDQHLADPELPARARAFVVAFRAIAAGRRDRSLADDPDLPYTGAAELLCAIDALEP